MNPTDRHGSNRFGSTEIGLGSAFYMNEKLSLILNFSSQNSQKLSVLIEILERRLDCMGIYVVFIYMK